MPKKSIKKPAAQKSRSPAIQSRPPIVVVLGHVDHGKTSILDYIRKTKVAEKETGGITQHIGAYQIEHQGKIITFIDTPGHEAFSAMRSRGAKVADIAILVVAAEEGVKPQTKEAIRHIQKAGISAIVAINKIDKPQAQPEKVKKELAENGLSVESLGGEIPSVNVSAKTGQGIDGLLEMILLVAEMAELKSQPELPAKGVVVESYNDARRGPTATLLIKEGTLKNKDIIATDSALGRIKSMESFQSQRLEQAAPATPVIITGFNQPPKVGEKFIVFETMAEAESRVKRKTAKRKEEAEVMVFEPEKKVLNIILKADVRGSLEAIREALKTIPDTEVILRFIKTETGQVTESDIKLAESAQAKIIGFRIKIAPSIQKLAEHKKIKIITFEIIYELVQGVRDLASKLLAPEIIRNILGRLKVLLIFKTEKNRQIVGARVLNGQIKKAVLIDVLRLPAGKQDEYEKISEGRLVQLQRNKKDIDQAAKNQEVGILFEGKPLIQPNDILEVYQEERKKREL